MVFQSYIALVKAQLTAFFRSRRRSSGRSPSQLPLSLQGIMARNLSATFMMPGLLTTMLISGASSASTMPWFSPARREVLRRFRVTRKRATMILAHGTTALIQNAITFCMVLTVARFAFQDGDHAEARSGRSPYSSSRVLHGSPGPAGRKRGAGHAFGPHRQLPLLPAVFSGSAPPSRSSPSRWRLRRASRPPRTSSGRFGDHRSAAGASQLPAPSASLTALGLVGLGLASMLFRWEGTEPYRGVPSASSRELHHPDGGHGLLWRLPPQRANCRVPGHVRPGTLAGKVQVLPAPPVSGGLGGRIENAAWCFDPRSRRNRPGPEGGSAAHAGRFGAKTSPGPSGSGPFDSHMHRRLGRSGQRPGRRRSGSERSGLGALASRRRSGGFSHPMMRARSQLRLSSPQRSSDLRVFFAGASITAPGGRPPRMFSSCRTAEQLARQVGGSPRKPAPA